MNIDLKQNELKSYVVENVPDELVNFVQSTQVSCMSMQDMLVYMLSKQDFNEESFIKYHNDKYVTAFLEFDMAKDKITKEITPEEIKDCNNISWNMDFKNKSIIFMANINDRKKEPEDVKVFDITDEECENLRSLQVMISAMNDLLNYMINRKAQSIAIDTYIKIKDPIFSEYDTLKNSITNKYTPEDFKATGVWNVDFDRKVITFTR